MKRYSENTNIGLRHLRAAHMVWQQGSFTHAADILGVVPSALSETIRQLEELAGTALFSRKGRPILPTPLGLSFLQETAPLVAGLTGAMERLFTQGRLMAGSLRIGASPSAISGLIAPAIAGFHQHYPDITITLHDDIAEHLADMVIAGDLDLALAGRSRETPELHQRLMKRDPVVLGCRTDSVIFAQGRISLEEIDPARLIHLDPQTGTADLIASAPELGERFRHGPLKAHSTVAQLCLLRAGVGYALMPLEALQLFNDPLIGHVEVAGLTLERSLYLLTPRHRPASHLATIFESFL